MAHVKKLLLATLAATIFSGVAVGAEMIGTEHLDPYVDAEDVASAGTAYVGIEHLDPYVDSSDTAIAGKTAIGVESFDPYLGSGELGNEPMFVAN